MKLIIGMIYHRLETVRCGTISSATVPQSVSIINFNGYTPWNSHRYNFCKCQLWNHYLACNNNRSWLTRYRRRLSWHDNVTAFSVITGFHIIIINQKCQVGDEIRVSYFMCEHNIIFLINLPTKTGLFHYLRPMALATAAPLSEVGFTPCKNFIACYTHQHNPLLIWLYYRLIILTKLLPSTSCNIDGE